MIVNTASFCGNTPQYADLQTLYERYRDQGFYHLSLSSPMTLANKNLETTKRLLSSATPKYSLEFPLFSKITVLGDQKHPSLSISD